MDSGAAIGITAGTIGCLNLLDEVAIFSSSLAHRVLPPGVASSSGKRKREEVISALPSHAPYGILEINAAPGLENYAACGEKQAARGREWYKKVINAAGEPFL
jgi:hypothetical protein